MYKIIQDKSSFQHVFLQQSKSNRIPKSNRVGMLLSIISHMWKHGELSTPWYFLNVQRRLVVFIKCVDLHFLTEDVTQAIPVPNKQCPGKSLKKQPFLLTFIWKKNLYLNLNHHSFLHWLTLYDLIAAMLANTSQCKKKHGKPGNASLHEPNWPKKVSTEQTGESIVRQGNEGLWPKKKHEPV